MKKISKKLGAALIAVFMAASTLTGCYLNEQVGASEVGIQLKDGAISSVVSAGRYSGGMWEDLKIIDISAHTNEWEDSDVWTKDKQSVRFSVSLTYSRARDRNSIQYMWENFNMEARENTALYNLVVSRVPRIVKQVTTTYTLDEMLGIADSVKNRTTLQAELTDLLTDELANCGITLVDLGINDIGVDEVYASKLKEKATAQIEVELAAEKARQLEEQMRQEEAQTKIDLEIAKRNNLVAEEEAKVYALSPETFELERLRLLKDVIGSSSKIYFVPEGTDLSLYFTGESVASDEKVVQSSMAE